MLTDLALDFGCATHPPPNWDFLVGMTRLKTVALVQKDVLNIPRLELGSRLAKQLAALPALRLLAVPTISLGAGGAGQQGGNAQAAEGAGAGWYLPSLRTVFLTGCLSLTCTDAATLAERVPNAMVFGLAQLHFNTSSDDTPEQLQRKLRSLMCLGQRGWLDVHDAPQLVLEDDFTASVQQLEHACQALYTPPGGTAGGAVEGNSGAGGSGSGPVLTTLVRLLHVNCEVTPAHMAWLAAFMPCVREIECSWELLEALPDLSALPCLELLIMHNPLSMEDPDEEDEAKEECAAGMCAALGKLRVPPGRVVEVHCGDVLPPDDLRLPAACLASHGLRLIDG